MKMLKLIVVLLLVIVAVVVYQKYGKSTPTPAPNQPELTAQEMQKKQNAENDKPRVEEKYGFTSRQPGE